MNGLRQQHAAGIALHHAASLRKIIGGSPPANRRRYADQFAERAVAEQLTQRDRALPKPMLQYHAEGTAAARNSLDQRTRAWQIDVHGFFDQHMLTGMGGAKHHVGMR